MSSNQDNGTVIILDDSAVKVTIGGAKTVLAVLNNGDTVYDINDVQKLLDTMKAVQAQYDANKR